MVATEPTSLSANIGVLWEPNDWFAWGATYLSSGPVRAKGKYTFTYSDDWIGFFQGIAPTINPVRPALEALNIHMPYGKKEETGTAKVNLTSPAQFSTGIKLVVLPDWQVNYDIKWMDWGKWKDLTIKFDQDMEFLQVASLLAHKYAPDFQTLIIPREYKSVWNWSIGIQHRYNNSLTLRAGYEPRKSSIPPDKQDVLLPLGDGKLFTAGAEYAFRNEVDLLKNSTVGIAVGYMHATANVPGGTSTNSNAQGADNFIYNPYAGLDFKNDVKVYIAEASYRKEF